MELTFWLELEAVDTEAAEFRSPKNPAIFSLPRDSWIQMGKPVRLAVVVKDAQLNAL